MAQYNYMREKLLTAAFLICVLLIFGTVSYHYIESWSYVDSFYFTAMTITTVGYGDFVPTTDMAKLFTVLFSFAGISIAVVILLSIGGDYYEREQQAFRTRIKDYIKRKKERLKQRKKVLKKTQTARRLRFWLSKRRKLRRR